MHDALPRRAAFEALTRRSFLERLAATSFAGAVALPVGAQAAAQGGKAPELAFQRFPDALQLSLGAKALYRYQLTKPGLGGASVDSGCYFHPVTTPSGVVVTDVGPEDHRHHRGIFFGFVEVRGAFDGDFWGWGEPAPVKGRRIVNTAIHATEVALGYGQMRLANEWQVEGRRFLREDVRIGCGVREKANVIDMTLRLSADSETTLARWAFGGFAVRTRKDAQIRAFNAQGPVTLPAPKHTDPQSNWPDAPWHGLHLKFVDGKEATVVVAGRTTNPPTTWHVVPAIGLLNPCVTAPGALKILPDKPLGLRYQVMVWDGPPDLTTINSLAEKWYYGRL